MIDFLQHIRGIIMAIKYKNCVSVGNSMGDRSYCSVIALATGAQIPHKKAYHVMRQYGRKHKQGAWTHESLAAFQSLGFETKLVTSDYPEVKTVITAERHLPKDKTFLITIRGHIFTMRNGVIEDWSEGRKHKIKKIFEIIPQPAKLSKNAQRKAKRYNK
jgi:hypothetical protein